MRRVAVVPALASIGTMLLFAGTKGAARSEATEGWVHRTFKGVMVSDMDTPPRSLAAARAGVVRINAGKAVSPTRRFRVVRRYAARLKNAGIRPLPLLVQNRRLTDRQWKRAVRTFAGNVPAKFLEIGNEPRPEAWRRYFHLARLAAPIIHAHRKRMVLAAPMSVDTIRYLRAAKATGDIFTRADGVAIHPYAPRPYRVQRLVGQARRIVPWRLPFWITEVGWGTGPNQDGEYGGLDVTASTQARYVTSLYNRLFPRGKTWNLASVGYFIWKDYGSGGTGNEWYHRSGLLRIDGTRKPAYAKYAVRRRVYRQG
jgi:hypothetical protein